MTYNVLSGTLSLYTTTTKFVYQGNHAKVKVTSKTGSYEQDWILTFIGDLPSAEWQSCFCVFVH